MTSGSGESFKHLRPADPEPCSQDQGEGIQGDGPRESGEAIAQEDGQGGGRADRRHHKRQVLRYWADLCRGEALGDAKDQGQQGEAAAGHDRCGDTTGPTSTWGGLSVAGEEAFFGRDGAVGRITPRPARGPGAEARAEDIDDAMRTKMPSSGITG